jgi:hypothetical protein
VGRRPLHDVAVLVGDNQLKCVTGRTGSHYLSAHGIEGREGLDARATNHDHNEVQFVLSRLDVQGLRSRRAGARVVVAI